MQIVLKYMLNCQKIATNSMVFSNMREFYIIKEDYGMKKSVNNLLIILCYVIFVVFFAGCGLFFNPSNHVNATLNFVYKGEFEQYSKLKSIRVDELKNEYEKNYEERAGQLAKLLSFVDENGNVKMSESIKSQLVEFAKTLYSKADYKLSDSVEKMENYGYIIKVQVLPIMIFEDSKDQVKSFADKYNSDIIEGKYNDKTAYSEDDVSQIYQQGILDILKEKINNLRYGEPQYVDLRFIHTGNAKADSEDTLCEEDVNKLSELIVKYPS